MKAPLKIAVADDEADVRDYYQRILRHLGHEVIVVADNGRQLVERCLADWPDVVITDIKMPEMDGIDASTALYHHKPIPVILVSAYYDADLVKRAEEDHVMCYLVKPIKTADLEPALSLTMRRFEQFEALRKEVCDPKKALELRKMMERAKKIVMLRANCDEVSAFSRLEEIASKRSQRLIDIAEMILVADEAFRPFISRDFQLQH